MTLLEVDEAANAIAGQVDPRPTSSSAPRSTQPQGHGSASRWWPPAWTAHRSPLSSPSITAAPNRPAPRAWTKPRRLSSRLSPPAARREPEPAYPAAIGEPKVFRASAARPDFSSSRRPLRRNPKQPAFTFESRRAGASPRAPGRTGGVPKPTTSRSSPPDPTATTAEARGAGSASLAGPATRLQPSQRPRLVLRPAPTLAAESPEEPPEDNNEDLEIPSFLRRLAN